MAAVAAVAVPRFESLAAATGDVTAAVEAACADPTEANVAAALDAVDSARQRWMETRAMWTGPVMDRRSAGLIDWTVDAEGVSELVEGHDAAELTPELIAGSVGADVRGLRSLYGVLARDDAVELLADPRWCAYATSVATTIDDEATAIESAWTVGVDGEPPFADVVTDGDAGPGLAGDVRRRRHPARPAARPPARRRGRRAVAPTRSATATCSSVASTTSSSASPASSTTRSTPHSPSSSPTPARRCAAGDLDLAHERLEEVDKTLSTDVAGQLDVTVGFSDADGDGSG